MRSKVSGGPRATPLGRFARATGQLVLRFLRDRRGGAMLFAGAVVIVTLFVGGAGLLNLAWRESHLEEIRAALRAGIASVDAALLAQAGDGGAVDAAIAERVGEFVEAATPTDVEQVTVAYDDGRIDIGMVGQTDVDPIWGFGNLSDGSFDESQAVELSSTRHEFALALDVSRSMGNQFGAGTRLDALKAAMRSVATNLENAQRDSPAGMLVSVVPFASTVSVADTSGIGETEEKARYLRMMGGRLHAKWVDVFHHLGVGGTQEMAIPAGWAWDTNVWSGCFMARWGAYWDPLARPTPMVWPATLNGEPLHLSDAAPDIGNANTLFTAYSWPDANPAESIDALLQLAMAEVLGGGSNPVSSDWVGDNDWSLPDGGGAALCQESPVLPLTDDVAIVRQAVLDLSLEQAGPGNRSHTYTHLAIVWGLRVLSAGWSDIWNTRDFRGVPRPLPPAPDVEKTLLVVSDGHNVAGSVVRGQLRPLWRAPPYFQVQNPLSWYDSPACRGNTYLELEQAGYHRAAMLDDGAFNAAFDPARWRQGLAAALRRASLATRLDSFQPVDVFRGTNATFANLLVGAGLPRPTQVRRHLCDYTNDFGPYGRAGDPLYVGGEPVFGQSPWPSREELPSPYPTGSHAEVARLLRDRLYEWWDGACAVAANREVQIHTIFIGDENQQSAAHIDSLRRCSASTGGEMLVTPDAAALQSAFSQLIRLRRQLRFVD